MYLPQGVSFPPCLGIDWDFFQHLSLAQEGKLLPAVVGCSVTAPLFSAAPLQPRQVRRGKTGPFQRRIARARLHLPSGMSLGDRNPANQAVRPSPAYL